VGNSEIERICRSIYKKHQKALDLIFQYRPDINLEISEYLQNLLKKDRRVSFLSASKTYVHFGTEELKRITDRIIKASPESKYILYMEFRNFENRLAIYFLIGPGEQDYRQKLYDIFKTKKDLFKILGDTLYKKYNTVYQKKILNPNDYKEASIDELSKKIDERWEEFCSNDLIKINEYLKNKASKLFE
jgi:hypothetical protein